MSAASRRTAAPAACSPSTRSVPLASGLVNGPRTCACKLMPCQDTSARGCMAGALAVTSRSAARPSRSSVPFASARSGPGLQRQRRRGARARPVQPGLQGDRSQRRQGGQVRHQPAVRLLHVQGQADAGRVNARLGGVGAAAVQAVAAAGRRCRPARRARPRRRSRDRTAAVPATAPPTSTRSTWTRRTRTCTGRLNGLLSAAGVAGGGGGHGQARHLHPGGAQQLHVRLLADQRQRRPVQRHVVRQQPGALRVPHLQVHQPQPVREAPVQAHDGHLPAGQPAHQQLRRHPAWPDVQADQQRGHGQRRHPQQQRQRPQPDLARAPRQNACPMPM